MSSRLLVILFTVAVLSFSATESQAASPTGSWRGSWSSQTTGHRGPLKAHVRQTSNDTYRAVFVGRFAGVIPFIYPAKLERVKGTCDCYTSRQRIGSYRMTATVTSNQFHAKFQGRKDSGTFDMSR
jgi:hypothetical protein